MQEKNIVIMNRIIFVLSLIGIFIAIYVLQGFLRNAPIVCINSGCELVRKHPASYLWGIPVPAFGLVGYTCIAILSFARTLSQNKKLLLGILGVTVFGVGFISWFTLTEIFVIRAVCTWCAISASIMVFLFSLTLITFLKDKELHEIHR